MRLRLMQRQLLANFLVFALVLCVGVASSSYVAHPVHASSNFTVPRLTQDQSTPRLIDGQHSLKGGETRSYLIKLTAGQFLSALVEQVGIDLVVSIFGPD